MNGQDRSHPLVSSCTGINTSTVSSNGGPSGAVSQSWLREMVADPRIAAQAGIINSRQDMQGPLLNTPFDPNNPNSSRTNMSGMSVNPLLHSFYNNINGSSSNPMFPPGSQFSMSERPLPSSTLASAVGSADQQRLLMTYTSSADTLNTRPMFTQPAYKASPRDLQPSSSKSSTNSELSSNIPAKRLKTVNDEQNSSSSAHAPATVQHSSLAPIPHRPDYFHKGSVIQLSEQKLKRIEDLQTADFELSASISPNLSLDCSTVVKITEDKARGTAFLTFSVGDSTRQKPVEATVEATVEHPFFVFEQGWSSVSPEKSLSYYKMNCRQLDVHDRCISLTFKDTMSITACSQGASFGIPNTSSGKQ